MSNPTQTTLLSVLGLAASLTVAHADALYTRTQGGVVSIAKGLTASECEHGRRRALADIEELRKKSDAWWESAARVQKEEAGPGEIVEIEGWPTVPATMIVDANCLK